MNFRVGALSILLGGASVFSDDRIDSSKGHIDDVECDTEGLETLCAAISSLPDLVDSMGGASVFSDDCIDTSKGHIDDVVCDTEGLETLCAAISSLPDLVESMGRMDTAYTLFAPTNDGFNKFLEVEAPGETIDDILADPSRTEALLLTHLNVGFTPICLDDLRCSNLVYMADGSRTKTVCLSIEDGPTTEDCKLGDGTADDDDGGRKLDKSHRRTDDGTSPELDQLIYQKGSANGRSKCNLPLVIGPDIGVRNGVIHTINNVIVN